MKFIVDFDTDQEFDSEEEQEKTYSEFIFDALDFAGSSVHVNKMKEGKVMWSINLTVIFGKQTGDLNIAETIKGEISEILEKHLILKDLDDYAVSKTCWSLYDYPIPEGEDKKGGLKCRNV
jgi:hypothetical protein